MRYFAVMNLMDKIPTAAVSKTMRLGVLMAIVVVFTSFTTDKTNKKRKSGVHIITIDAGHGGYDPGCQFAGKREKDITLGIALKLGKAIKDNLDDVKVIYTRTDDSFVELWERADLANKNKSDIFISIHVNSNPTTNISGTETYTMGLHKTESNLEVAKRENGVILLEDNYNKKYDGFDPKSPEGHIIFSLYQDAHMDQSIRFAGKVENIMGKNAGRYSRGVKQAGFLVLWKTAMPSTLIETGFLSNPTERKFLSSEAGQETLALSIFKAVRDYKNEIEGREK